MAVNNGLHLLELRLSGGASNTDAALSLGGAMSSTRIISLISTGGEPTGVTFLDGWGFTTASNTIYILSYTAATKSVLLSINTLGTDQSGSIDISIDGSYTLMSASKTAGMSLIVDESALPATDGVFNITTIDAKDKLFDSVSPSESYLGSTAYRACYLYNASVVAIDNVVFRRFIPGPGASTYQVDRPVGFSSTSEQDPLTYSMQLLTSETDAPAVNNAFSNNNSNIYVLTLQAGQCLPIWIQRVSPVGISQDITAGALIFWEGDFLDF